MKWFILPAGMWILIDEIDIPVIQTGSWRLCNWGYIIGITRNNPYENKCLHRIIAERMNLNLSNLIDHKDGNKLNNQRDNLRPATHAENTRNSKRPINNTSGYKGVSWHKRLQKWQAKISVNGRRIHLGYFDTSEEAHAAYCKAADKYHGEFARYD